MDIQKFCEDSHRISKEKGWLDDPRPFDEICDLFHSELSEALEDYRNNRGLTEFYYEVSVEIAREGFLPSQQTYANVKSEEIEKVIAQAKENGWAFKSAKPCGIPIELADFIIRIAQYCGTNGLSGELGFIVSKLPTLTKVGGFSFGKALAHLHADVSMAYLVSTGVVPFDGFPSNPIHYLASAWHSTFQFCEKNGIDLEKAILEKQAYNETRPHRHGGKKI